MTDKLTIDSLRLTSDVPEIHYDGSMGASMAQGGMDVDGLIFVYVGDACVADFQLEKTPSAWHMHTSVATQWQRKGIASALYDLVEAQANASGAKLAPSPSQTEEAILFWEHRVESRSSQCLAKVCPASDKIKARRALSTMDEFASQPRGPRKHPKQGLSSQ